MKNKIKKIIKDNFKLDEFKINKITEHLIKDHDLEHPSGGLDEQAIVELTDNILYEEDKKKNKKIFSKEKIISKVLDKLSRLKYNYFSTNHPNKSIRGKLFKFTDSKGYSVKLIKDDKTLNLSKDDFYEEGKKLYHPADMG